MEAKQRPQFGQEVTVTAKAVRAQRYELRGSDEFRYTQRRKVWERLEFAERRVAIYIGYRTKFDGETRWEDEAGTVFTATAHRELWLVVEDERSSPYFAWPEDCEVKAEAETS